MAQKRQRVAAVIAALIFLVSSLAASVGVIYLLVTNKDKDTNATTTTDTSQQENQQSKLVGTKMENFTPTDTPVESLQITDTNAGTGDEAKEGGTVTVAYVGALVKDGTIFDASPEGKPATLSLTQVIEGWQKGIPGMKVGGTRRLVIPAAQAYGAQSPSPAIPANSDLVFDVTLVAVK